MGILTIILSIIGALIVILLIAAALSADDYKVESEMLIDRPSTEVFEYVKYLKNQEHFNKWVMQDPNVRKEFKGTDGTVGFFYAWESDNKQVGKGEQVIKQIVEGKLIDYDLHFIQPFEGRAESYIETIAQPGGHTRVVWVFKGKRNFIMKVMHIAFNLKKMLGKDLTTSLQNLKAILEK